METPVDCHQRKFRALTHPKSREDQIIEFGPNGHSYKVIARVNTARPGWRHDALLLAAAPQMRAILETIRASRRNGLSGGVYIEAAELVAIRRVLNIVEGK